MTLEEFLGRCQRARDLMARAGLDALVIGPSADFRYLTGCAPRVTERLTALFLPRAGRPTIVHPAIERETVHTLASHFDLEEWRDGLKPTARIAELLAKTGAQRFAVNDDLWSGFLIEICSAVPAAAYGSASQVLGELRRIKSPAEVEALRDASRRLDAVWEAFVATEKLTGRSERMIEVALRRLMGEHGLTDVVWCDVSTGSNGALPSHRNGDRVVQAGEPVVIDLGAGRSGYYGDMCRTPVAERVSDEVTGVYRIVAEAQEAGVRAVAPGRPCQEVDRGARRVIEQHGFGSQFTHRVGHGIGLAAHEHPYMVEGNTELLRPGMTFSVEPGIYLVDRYGIRIEDVVAVTAAGCERLNQADRELTVMA